MKKLFSILIILVAFSFGCSASEDAANVQKMKPVKVMELKQETRDQVLQYTGMVAAGTIKKVSFEFGGRVKEIAVKKGEAISAGQLLARLDPKDIKLALSAAAAQKTAALEAYNFAQDDYEKLEKLYQEGAVPRRDVDKAQLQVKLRQAQLDQAAADYSLAVSQTEDTSLTADMDGFVVDILSEEGEVVAAGYPVLVIRAGEQVVNVGLTGGDSAVVTEGTPARVSVNGKEVNGRVSSIAQVPEQKTLTYKTEIAVAGAGLAIGTTANVEFVLGRQTGMWVPITAIVAGKKDYVFVVSEGTVGKRDISIKETTGAEAKVEGLKPGEKLVTEGMKQLEPGDKVTY